MATFPKSEAELLTMAMAMENGFKDNLLDFPAPPVDAAAFGDYRNEFVQACDVAIAAQAASSQATTDKQEALESLIDAMKTNIRYAENVTKFDDNKLKLIGWGGRASGTALQVPGQVRSFEVIRQGAGWVVLDWKKPAEGGAVASYKVMRRERPAGAWTLAAIAVNSDATLVEQPQGKELEYLVIAVNKAGEGTQSNTEMVVL